MKYRSPDVDELRELVGEEDVRTLIAPTRDGELTESEVDLLEDRVHRTKEGSGRRKQLFYNVEDAVRGGEHVAEICELDVEMLAKVLYEHRRYSLARGFSDAEMDVLRAVEFHDATRVGVDEIMDSSHAEDLAESTIYKALRTLQDKELIEKVRPGVYQYTGP